MPRPERTMLTAEEMQEAYKRETQRLDRSAVSCLLPRDFLCG
jgi:hypothetical protein